MISLSVTVELCTGASTGTDVILFMTVSCVDTGVEMTGIMAIFFDVSEPDMLVVVNDEVGARSVSLLPVTKFFREIEQPCKMH